MESILRISLCRYNLNIGNIDLTLFLAADTVAIYFFVQVVLETSRAITEFQLDPRARPPFDSVFFYQYCLTTTISVELFLRILHLVITFSVLNSVKSKFSIEPF